MSNVSAGNDDQRPCASQRRSSLGRAAGPEREHVLIDRRPDHVAAHGEPATVCVALEQQRGLVAAQPPQRTITREDREAARRLARDLALGWQTMTPERDSKLFCVS